MKTETYSGNDLLKTNIFGFYWNNYDSNGYTPIKEKTSMNNILKEFKKQYKPLINKKLNTIGLELVDIEYYNPKAYNYGDDELDFKIKIVNLKKYLDFLLKNKLIDKNDMETSINNNYYNPSIDEMSNVFEILNLTANDLQINVEFILNNIEYDMRYKENRGY